MKESFASFLSNILAVILGIFITFTIQGMIDRSSDRKNARSSLELVRSELLRNIEDISIMKDYLVMEKESARYQLPKRLFKRIFTVSIKICNITRIFFRFHIFAKKLKNSCNFEMKNNYHLVILSMILRFKVDLFYFFSYIII